MFIDHKIITYLYKFDKMSISQIKRQPNSEYRTLFCNCKTETSCVNCQKTCTQSARHDLQTPWSAVCSLQSVWLIIDCPVDMYFTRHVSDISFSVRLYCFYRLDFVGSSASTFMSRPCFIRQTINCCCFNFFTSSLVFACKPLTFRCALAA